jgi:L-iditol 2-dehydrogenase
MRVAMYYSNDDIRLEKMAQPAIGPGEMLIRIEASGVCGSDTMEWYRAGRVPLVLGHEVAGTVAETGKGVTRYKKGDRIVAAHHVPCGECRYCLSGHPTVCDTLRKTNFHPGGFSEMVKLPAINVEKGVFRIPDGVSYEEATFAEPLACVLRGQRRAGLRKGDTAVVIGSGISGILHINLAKASGASKVIATDLSAWRCDAAKRFGADIAIDGKADVPSRVAELTGGILADIVIVTTGSPAAIMQGLKSIRRGGVALFFAATEKDVTIPFPVNDIFWRTEVTLMSSYAASPAEHEEALELIRAKKVDAAGMITHRLKLADTGEGFKLVVQAKDSLKVIIEPQK